MLAGQQDPCRVAIFFTAFLRHVGTDPACWTAGFTKEFCCDLGAGPEGNEACWHPAAGYTYERCCGIVSQERRAIAQTQWHKAISDSPQFSILALGLSSCARVYHFGTTGNSRISRFVQFSGDPVRHLWKTTVCHNVGNKRGCQSIYGILWSVSAHIAGFPRGNEWGQGEPVFINFEFCAPELCTQAEVEELASDSVVKHLEALSAIAVVESVHAELHEDLALHSGWYVVVTLVFLVMTSTGLEHLTGGKHPLSAQGALEDLFGERMGECFLCHVLRATCSLSVVLYHFHAEHYEYTPSFRLICRLLESWRIVFFSLSFYLQTQRVAIGNFTYGAFAARIWRKLQRQILLAVFFQLVFAIHYREQIFEPSTKILSQSRGWIDLFIFMEFNWQVAAELWQFLFVSALLLIEAQGVGLSYVSWGVFWSFVIPVFWGFEEKAVPYLSHPGRHFWTVRVPVSLVFFGMRHAAWLKRAPLMMKLICFLGANVLNAADVLDGTDVLNKWFWYEVAFQIPLLLMLPASIESCMSCPSTPVDVVSRLTIAASRLAPLIMVLSGNEKVLEEGFRACSLSMGMDWKHALIVQGPLLLVWCHVVCFLVWVFAYRPLLRLIEEATCWLPQGIVQVCIVPGFLLTLVAMPRHSAPPLFHVLPWKSFS